MARHNYVQQTIVSAGNLASSFDTDAIDVRGLINCSFNCICTGSPTGTFTVQWSNDGSTFYNLLDSNGSDVELTLGGSAENLQFDLTNFSYGYFRLSYASGGTGAVDIIYQGKSL